MSSPAVHPIVIRFGRVGDMILLSALLGILHRRYGAACRLIGAGALTAQIYAEHGDVAHVHCLRRYTVFLFDRAWWGALRALRAARRDPVYVCEPDPRRLRRVRRLLALSGTDPARCLFITRSDCFREPHWIDRLGCFGRLTPPALNAGAYPWPAPPPPCVPHLEVPAAARAECTAWIAARGWTDRPLVLIQPGNRRTMRGRRLRVSAADDKAWPIERWAALVHGIQERMPEAVILLCGAAREASLLEWIAAAAHLPPGSASPLALPRLLALCARAHSMISVDTGPAHAAAALSLPLVVLFGANSQREWLPRSPARSPVVGVGGPPRSSRLDEIGVETVLRSWSAMVEADPALARHLRRA
jgi:heptosyltransferase-2/heptosyltransferase-3